MSMSQLNNITLFKQYAAVRASLPPDVPPPQRLLSELESIVNGMSGQAKIIHQEQLSQLANRDIQQSVPLNGDPRTCLEWLQNEPYERYPLEETAQKIEKRRVFVEEIIKTANILFADQPEARQIFMRAWETDCIYYATSLRQTQKINAAFVDLFCELLQDGASLPSLRASKDPRLSQTIREAVAFADRAVKIITNCQSDAERLVNVKMFADSGELQTALYVLSTCVNQIDDSVFNQFDPLIAIDPQAFLTCLDMNIPQLLLKKLSVSCMILDRKRFGNFFNHANQFVEKMANEEEQAEIYTEMVLALMKGKKFCLASCTAQKIKDEEKRSALLAQIQAEHPTLYQDMALVEQYRELENLDSNNVRDVANAIFKMKKIVRQMSGDFQKSFTEDLSLQKEFLSQLSLDAYRVQDPQMALVLGTFYGDLAHSHIKAWREKFWLHPALMSEPDYLEIWLTDLFIQFPHDPHVNPFLADFPQSMQQMIENAQDAASDVHQCEGNQDALIALSTQVYQEKNLLSALIVCHAIQDTKSRNEQTNNLVLSKWATRPNGDQAIEFAFSFCRNLQFFDLKFNTQHHGNAIQVFKMIPNDSLEHDIILEELLVDYRNSRFQSRAASQVAACLVPPLVLDGGERIPEDLQPPQQVQAKRKNGTQNTLSSKRRKRDSSRPKLRQQPHNVIVGKVNESSNN